MLQYYSEQLTFSVQPGRIHRMSVQQENGRFHSSFLLAKGFLLEAFDAEFCLQTNGLEVLSDLGG